MASITDSLFGRNNGTQRWVCARPLHLIGSNLYMVTIQETDNKIHVHKSTNYTTSWTEMDSANALAPVSDLLSYDVASDGTDLFIYYHTATNTSRVRKFLTGTDLWDTADVHSANAHVLSSGDYNKRITVRSDGTILLNYRRSDVSDSARVHNTGGSWSTSSIYYATATSFPLDSIYVPSTGIVHLVWYVETNNDVVHRGISMANTLAASSTAIDATAAIMYSAVGAYVNDGGTHRAAVAYIDSTGELDFAHSATAETENTITTLVGGVSPTTTTDPGTMGSVTVPFNSKWHVLWSGDGRGSIHMDISDDYATPTFGTDTDVVTGLGNDPFVAAIPVGTSGVLCAYTNPTGPVVDFVWAVGSAPSTGGQFRMRPRLSRNTNLRT